MNCVVRTCIVVCLFIGFSTSNGLSQVPGPPMQGQLIRSTTGRGIDSSGFANVSVPLKKGAVYDVVKQSGFSSVLIVEGKNVVVSNNDLSLSQKPQVAAATEGFVPGTIVLVSAKYSLEGNQSTNVKNNLQKLIPAGIIKAPVVVFVTDALSIAAQDQASAAEGMAAVAGSAAAALFLRPPAPNVLTVVYTFNGQRFTKEVTERNKLVLP